MPTEVVTQRTRKRRQGRIKGRLRERFSRRQECRNAFANHGVDGEQVADYLDEFVTSHMSEIKAIRTGSPGAADSFQPLIELLISGALSYFGVSPTSIVGRLLSRVLKNLFNQIVENLGG